MYQYVQETIVIMPVKISVLLVNLNNLEYTKQCLDDLLNQDIVFNLRLVDQNSSETGTKEFFDDFFTKHSNGNIINTYLTNQISPNIPTFSIPNWIAGTQTYVDLITGNTTGSITNLYNHQIGSPFPSGGAGGITVTNSYGVYINKQKTTNIVILHNNK